MIFYTVYWCKHVIYISECARFHKHCTFILNRDYRAEYEKLKAEKDKYGFNEKTTLKSAKVKGKKVTLKWNKVKGASGYEIYCKTGKGKWKLVKTLNKGSKASCKLKGKAGKKYTYKVRVFQKVENKVIYGQYSNTKSAKIKK